MGVPLDVPGLQPFVDHVPDGSLILAEGGVEPSASHFAHRVAAAAAREHRPVTVATSRNKADVKQMLAGLGEAESAVEIAEITEWRQIPDEARNSKDLVVDNFSFLAIDAGHADLRGLLRDLRRVARQAQGVIVLTADRDLLEPRAASLVNHLADGIVQFHTRDDSDGLSHFLRIPKWTDGRTFPNNIHYSFDGRRLLIDQRRRVA